MAELFMVEVEDDEPQYVVAEDAEACRLFVKREVECEPRVIHLLGEPWFAYGLVTFED